MKKQYVKNPIPEAISEDGGASIMFVNKQTVPLDGAIREALEGNYCTGQATLIRNFFFGLMQSMADGVRRDGHARQIANFLTVYPVFKGEVDMDRGYDPEVNGVMIRARLLNEMDLDITNWSFEDVTPGKRSFSLTSCSTGEADKEYRIGEGGHINGKNLPSTAAGEELRVHWEVEGTDKSGDIPAAKLSSEIDRIDIAADALAELADEAYDGKTIAFTVCGNFSSAKIAATLKFVVAPTVRIDKVIDQEGNEDNICYYDGVAHIVGENLMLLPGDTVKLRGTDWETHETIEHVFDDAVYNAETGKIDITVTYGELGRFESEPGADVIVTSRGGVSGSVPQVATRHVTLAGE